MMVQTWNRKTKAPVEPPIELTRDQIATRAGRSGRTELDIAEKTVRNSNKANVVCSNVMLKTGERLLVHLPPGELVDRLGDAGSKAPTTGMFAGGRSEEVAT